MVLVAGVPFGIVMGLFFSVIVGIQAAFLLGLVSAVCFGGAMATFLETQRDRMESKDGLFEGETVIYQGPANHFLNKESRGGWLTLTESRLCFRSHGSNMQNQPVNIEIKTISGVQPKLTLGIIPNGLRVNLKTGQSEYFIVFNRSNWIKLIAHQFKASQIYPDT